MTYSSSVWTLDNIITEVRGITGRPDASMMNDAQVTNYINFYYQNVLTKELKIFWGYTYYQFFTQANIDQYEAPSNFQTLNPQVWADGWPIEWYISPDLFYQDYPQQMNKEVVGTGDGVTVNFPFTTSAFPILVGSLYVTDNVQVAVDNGTPVSGVGGFVPPSSGSINYASGAVNLTFGSAAANNANITATYQTYMANRPQGILFFKSMPLPDSTQASITNDNIFVLRPVPDQVYLVKMQGIQVPAALVNSTDVPFRADLGPLIALGSALHIFKVFNQMDQYEQYLPEYNRFKDVSMQDTYEELLYTRAVPAF